MIDTRDALVAALQAAQRFTIGKASIANAVAGRLYSLWRATGVPTQGAIPGAAATCTDALTGSINLGMVNPTGGAQAAVLGLDLNTSLQGSWILYDRLAHMGGLNGTLTTAQTVNVDVSSITTRGGTAGLGYSDGVEWFLEWYTDTGATAVNATVTYTDQDGNAGNTVVVALVATSRASSLYRIVPASPDTWIRSVQSVQLSATTAAAGSFGVTAARRLCMAHNAVVNAGVQLNFAATRMPRVYDDACLWLVQVCTTTTTGTVEGEVSIGAG
jgi:hypothetical protein